MISSTHMVTVVVLVVSIMNNVLISIVASPSSSAWLKMCPSQTKCCKIWQNQVMKSDIAYQHFIDLKPNLELGCFDHFEPTWNCELKSRLPERGGDGPKWMVLFNSILTFLSLLTCVNLIRHF